MSKMSKPSSDDYIPRERALSILRVKPQTLYAYVSRGWIRSVRKAGSRRESLYARTDVERVRLRSAARIEYSLVAATAMRWGDPIIPTTITELTPEGPVYRGKPAIGLALSGTSFEVVAEWLWSGMWLEGTTRWDVQSVPAKIANSFGPHQNDQRSEHLMWQFSLLTLLIGATRGNVTGGWAPNPTVAARQLIQAMVGCMGILGPTGRFYQMQQGESIAQSLLRVLGRPVTPENTEMLQSLLILLADHELTSSTFAARIAASVGALLHGCVNVALATNSGTELGRLYDRIELLLSHNTKQSSFKDAVHQMQDRGMVPPGFNHPMYPRGDPRADYLLGLIAKYPKKSKQLSGVLNCVQQFRKNLNLRPRVELAAVLVGMSLEFPAHSSSGLFAIARTAGWVAHVLEQRTSGYMLRPRAKYTGQKMDPEK